MGWWGRGGDHRHHCHWTRAWVMPLLLVVAWMAAAVHGHEQHMQGRGVPTTGTMEGLPPPPPPPLVPQSTRLLLWLPMHASEPDVNLHVALACLFRRWTPSTLNQPFDVLVTVAGGAAVAASLRGRAAGMVTAVSAATAHIRPRPAVMAHPVFLAADIYDVDEARGRFSSYEGPNAVFYHVMGGLLEGSLRPEAAVVDAGGRPSVGGQPIVISTALPAYTLVHLIETDCCATSHGWLDALVQPMLANPYLLISGSRGRGACWTGREHGGCALTINRASPHAHLRDHINGNALYRLGPELGGLIAAAQAKHGARVPFDVALYLMGAGDRVTYDNARSYSAMALPVDTTRFADPAYYGDPDIAFVHVPRRLRASALDAVVRRLDVGKPVTLVVVPPRMGADEEGLLAHLHAGLARTGELRNTLFLALDEAEHITASRLAPLRVLLAGDKKESVEARILNTVRALAREGMSVFAIGLNTVILHPYSQQLLGLIEERPQAVWTAAAGGAPGAITSQTPILVPAKAAAAWLGKDQHTTSLPPDLFPPASSYVGPLWTGAARSNVAAVVTWDVESVTPSALAAVGLWSGAVVQQQQQQQPGVAAAAGVLSQAKAPLPPFTCANHSVLGTADPLRLASYGSIRRALRLHAAFDRFVRRHGIACVVLPDFRVGVTTVPAAAVVVLGRGHAGNPTGKLTRTRPLVFPSLAAMHSATGGRTGRLIPIDGWPGRDETHASSSMSFTTHLTTLIDSALASLPPAFHCVVDKKSSPRDVQLLAMHTLDAVAASVRSLVPPDTQAFLAGAWRHVGRRAWPPNASSRIFTLADLAAPANDPLASLVHHGPTPPTSNLASSPWAGLVEYAVCQHAAAVHKLDVTGTIPPTTLAHLAAHIPPAVLAEDLTTLTRWLARPDRPTSLSSAKRAALVLPAASPPITPSDFHDAVLAPALGLAGAGGADVVTLPRPPRHRPWSALIGEGELAAVHADHASLLPASVSWLLDGVAGAEEAAAYRFYPASLDVWQAAAHTTAVRALEEAAATAQAPTSATTTVHFPAGASPAQHARLRHFAEGARAEVFSF